MTQTILFMCPHNAAKSVLAVAYFDRLAREHNLAWRVASAGTEASAEVSPVVTDLLKTEGIDVSHYQPRNVLPEDLATASLIVSMGCPLDDLVQTGKVIYWNDVPMISQDLPGARQAILAKVTQLAQELKFIEN